MVGGYASEIFGKDLKYFDLNIRVSKAGIGPISNGYVITFEDTLEVHSVELELASHPLRHIVPQVVGSVDGVGIVPI